MSKQTGNSQAMESKKEENAIEPFKYKILGMNTKVSPKLKTADKYKDVSSLIRDVLTKEQPHLAFFQEFKNKRAYFKENVLLKETKEMFFVDEKAMIMIDLKEFEVINLEQLKIQGLINSTESLLDEMAIVKVYTNRNPKETFVCVALQRKEENAVEQFEELLEFLKTVGNHTEKQLPMLIVGGFNIAIGEIENLVEPPFKIQPFESKVRSDNKKMKDFFITRNLDLEKVQAVDIEPIAKNRNASSSKESEPDIKFSHDTISCALSKANIKTNENAQAESATNQTETPPWAKDLLKGMEKLETKISQLASSLSKPFENSGCDTHIPATEEGS